MQNSSSAMVVHLLPWFQTCPRQNWKLFTIVRSQGSFGVNSSHDLYFLRHPSFQSQGDFNFFATEQFLFNITTATASNVQTEMRLRPDASWTKLSKKKKPDPQNTAFIRSHLELSYETVCLVHKHLQGYIVLLSPTVLSTSPEMKVWNLSIFLKESGRIRKFDNLKDWLR